jgi:hypothetical protein
MNNETLPRLRRLLARAFWAALGLALIAGWQKGRLDGPAAMLPSLRQEPLQGPTDRKPFTFQYQGKACRVRPIATYELWGLVVSHNDIKSMADIYHDRSSVDTKDLCTVWGGNLTRDDYLRSSFKSGPFTCYVSFPSGVNFDLHGIGNHHLITDDPAVRAAIERVHLGDQVHLKGLLVDYQMDDWEDFWRKTSTRRDDFDCEVVFVQQIEVLCPGTPGWYRAWTLGWWLAGLLGAGWITVFCVEAGRNSVGLGRL